MIVIFDMPGCGACRTCEIACSYHHTGEFAPYLSSIKIHEKERGPGNIVELVENDIGEIKACDGCSGLEEHLCVEVCKEEDALRDMIKQLLRSKGERAA